MPDRHAKFRLQALFALDDLAAGDIVRSAFGHTGQKCSAASLAILVAVLALLAAGINLVGRWNSARIGERLMPTPADLELRATADDATF